MIQPEWTLAANHYDVIVVGGGHAGCEAALASARLGVRTLLLTLNTQFIGLMPCNPSIGGPGKGHLVRELGCLGGQMARTIDDTLLQIRLLNESRGPAVRALRAQADKALYSQAMKWVIENQPGLELRQAEVSGILTNGQGAVRGLKTVSGQIFHAPRIILCTGVYLSSRIIIGHQWYPGGPANQKGADFLGGDLRRLGFWVYRLQTATPPRLLKSSIDFSCLQPLYGDTTIHGFSYPARRFPKQLPCHIAETNERTMEIMARNLHLSPLKIGNIVDHGPKHCPSLDRKFINFPGQSRHFIFLEPEGWESHEVYLQGLTTATPAETQEELVHSVRGLEKGHILRYGYAIEYDAIGASQLRLTLETHHVPGLYTAGQINGTTGYEEAASQGFIAGVNAARAVLGQPPFILSRTEAYIGVLIDDLVQRDWIDPYRVTPSRAEYRLHLRHDNAPFRLAHHGAQLGLLDPALAASLAESEMRVASFTRALDGVAVNPEPEILSALREAGSGGLKKRVTLGEILARPGISIEKLRFLFPNHVPQLTGSAEELGLLEEEIKYRGYVERQKPQMEHLRYLDGLRFPKDYSPPNGIADSLRELFTRRPPHSLGQLSRLVNLPSQDFIRLLDSLRTMA